LDEIRKQKQLRDANATQAYGVMSFDASDKIKNAAAGCAIM
jgi:hypothetical protein